MSTSNCNEYQYTTLIYNSLPKSHILPQISFTQWTIQKIMSGKLKLNLNPSFLLDFTILKSQCNKPRHFIGRLYTPSTYHKFHIGSYNC
jgi:hypothetical protein